MTDRVAIVTGASSGIGDATARALSAEGFAVALAARRTERLDALRADIEAAGGRAIVATTDVTKRSDLEALAKATLEAFGRIDVLVNNAGLMPLSFMKNLHVDEWDRMIDVNIKGVLYGVAAVLPTMMSQRSGHIINVSSVAGRRTFPSGAVYCGTKFAVTAISEGLRAELAPSMGIRCTVIEPGVVRTELTQTITDDDVKPFTERILQMQALESEDIANAIVYAATQPAHVNVSEVLVLPTQQS